MKQLNGRGGVVRVRKWVVFAVACVVVLVAVAAAVAREGVDRSFGEDGVVDLRPLGGAGVIEEMGVAPDRGIHLLATTYRCGAMSCSGDLSLLRLNPDGSPDSAYGEGGVAAVARSVEGTSWETTLAVDGRGRTLVAYPVPGGVSLVRLAPGGSIDGSFGQGGVATLYCGCQGASTMVEFDREGRVLVVVRHGEYVKDAAGQEYWVSRIFVSRLLPNGSVDSSFDRVEAASRKRERPEAAFVGRGGSLVLAGEEPSAGLYLMRIGPRGAIDRRFGRTSRRALARLGLTPSSGFASTMVRALIPRRGGADVIGSSSNGGFRLRVLRSGRLDPRFGRDGLKRYRWRIDRAIAAGRGRVLVTGRKKDDWRQEFFLLDSRGSLDKSFHGGRPVILEGWRNFGGLAMQGRRPLLFDDGVSFCRSSCEAEPRLIRLTAPRVGR
jgi:hypothetical protein